MQQKDETDTVLGTDFVRCDSNDLTIAHACVLCIVYKEKLCVLQFQRGVNHSVVIWSIGSHSV